MRGAGWPAIAHRQNANSIPPRDAPFGAWTWKRPAVLLCARYRAAPQHTTHDMWVDFGTPLRSRLPRLGELVTARAPAKSPLDRLPTGEAIMEKR